MLSDANVSTFSDLLKSINKRIVDSRNQGLGMDEFKSLSIGADEYSTSYPYLMAIPVSETIQRYYTNDFADVIRKVSFRVRAIKPKQEASFGQANGLANNIKNLFNRKRTETHWKLPSLNNGNPIVFNVKISEITFADHINTPQGVVSEAQLDIDFYGQVKTDAYLVNKTEQLNQTNLKEMTKIIFELLTRYKETALFGVKTIKYGPVDPIRYYPAVVITPDVAEINSRFVGSDSYDSSYYVYVFTDFLNVPDSIYKNLDIIHQVRNILFANKYLFNRSYDYDFNDILIGTTYLDEVGHFTSQLGVNCSSFEPIS